MAVQPGPIEEDLQRGPEGFAPLPEELRLFARLEGLLGQERALLTIPHRERSAHEHELPAAVGAELDRVWERLRARAAAGHQAGPVAGGAG